MRAAKAALILFGGLAAAASIRAGWAERDCGQRAVVQFPNFTIDCNLTDGNTHNVSLYCLDWDGAGIIVILMRLLKAV